MPKRSLAAFLAALTVLLLLAGCAATEEKETGTAPAEFVVPDDGYTAPVPEVTREYTVYTDRYYGRTYKRLTRFDFYLSVPNVEEGTELGLIIEHDGRNTAEEQAMARMAPKGHVPYCVFLSVDPGVYTLPDGTERNMRLDDYDLLTDEYANLLVEELIPYVKEKYNLNISDDPDLHMTAGNSSGGISAFAIAWFRNDYFHRVYMSSPSFLSMARGNEFPSLVKKSEPKPLKVYMEYSENEPDEYFGSSYAVAIEMEKALAFAGYDYMDKYFPGEGHGSHYKNVDDANKRLKWLWEDYDTEPVAVKAVSTRVADVIPADSRWEKADTFPKQQPALSIESSDLQWIYSGETDDDVIRATAKVTGSVYLHGMLHTLPTIGPKGAIDLALDEEDRLYVLTAIGIQCVRSFGLIDVILSLPDGGTPEMIAIEGNDLYLKNESGIWVRELIHAARQDTPTEPKHIEYYD